MSRVMLFDIETDGLDLKKISTIHTMTIYDYKTDKFTRYDQEKVRLGINELMKADTVIGHNIINYDIPVIQKFYPDFKADKVLDTLVWARLVFADIEDIDFKLFKKGKLPAKLIGSHSLKAYGYRLGELKGDFNNEDTDWSMFTPEMSIYCEQDVRVTKKLYEKLLSKNVSKEALQLEHDVARIVKRQIDRGFGFDEEKAQALYVKLLQRKEELTELLQKVFKPWYVANGKPVTSKRGNKKKGIFKGNVYQKIKLIEFNPGSRHHIAKVLKDRYDWKPTEFTDAGQPKVDEAVLSALPYPEIKPLIEYLTVNKRLGQLSDGKKSWLRYVTPEGRIHGYVNTNGAITGRMTHSKPNLAQVPAVRAPYGKECRELFLPTKNYLQIGADASGLELRCLAHYMAKWDNGEYANVILTGDIHSMNQKAAGLPSRDNAKTFIYAFLYGAGDEKIGAIVSKGSKEGRRLKKQFLNKTPAIKKLKEKVEEIVKERGYLKGLDGRQLKIRSAHSALNTLLQSAGAIIMKKALVILDENLQQNYTAGIDYEFLANIHDEFQIEALPQYADVIGKEAVKAIKEAGKYFKFRCPLDGEYKIGKNWAECH